MNKSPGPRPALERPCLGAQGKEGCVFCRFSFIGFSAKLPLILIHVVEMTGKGRRKRKNGEREEVRKEEQKESGGMEGQGEWEREGQAGAGWEPSRPG